MVALIQFCGVFLLFLALTHGIDEVGKKKGVIDCGHVFNQSTTSVENNTLHPDTSCSYFIEPVNGTVPVRIFLKKLILDAMDNVTIFDNDTGEVLFSELHGQAEAVILISDATSIKIIIQTSSVSDITRHFVAFYDSIGQACSFVVDEDILAIQQPLIWDNKTHVDCKLIFVHKPNLARSFSFESFNLSGEGSSVSVSGVENPVAPFTKQDLPPDLFATAQVEFEIKTNSEDSFVLKQHHHNPDCSKYVKVSVAEKISMPVMPKLDNGSLLLECRWSFESTESSLGLTFEGIQLHAVEDVIVVTDGPRISSPILYQITSSAAAQDKENVIRTSGKTMIVSFKPSSLLSSFNATVTSTDQGGYVKNNGSISMKPSTKDNTWLLEVHNNETVVLNFQDSSFKSPAVLNIYDGFSLQSRLIATLYGNIWYPILSSTSRMMIVAKKFGTGKFSAEFKGSATGCMHMSQGSSDSYVLSKNCNSTCAWIIPPINTTDDLVLDLQYISLDENDEIQVLQLDEKKTVLATITPNITHVPQLNLKATDGAYINITRGLCLKKHNDIVLVAQANYLPKCSGAVTLTTASNVQLTSPGFPNTYPLLADCKWALTSSPPKQLIHIAFDKLQLAPNHCLVITENATKPVIYVGNTLPADLFLNNDALVQFNSDNCHLNQSTSSLSSDQGFVLNATVADCGRIYSTATGVFSTVANKTLCLWKISVPPTEKGAVNIITFAVNIKDKAENYQLYYFDGESVRDKKMTNFTGSEIWSRTNSIILVYRPLNISKPAAEIAISYQTKSCDKSMQCENGICLHPDWRCNGVNDCGDFTDEKDCASIPVKPTPAPETGVSSVSFGIGLLLMFFLGVLLAIFVPVIFNKLRNGQYRQFRDVSVIE